VKNAQLPFGIGAAACLYASTEFCIMSKVGGVHISLKEFLSGKENAVLDKELSLNTTMVGLKLKEDIDAKTLIRQCDCAFNGFPVEIELNGKPIERKNAIGNKAFYWYDAPFGKVGLSYKLDSEDLALSLNSFDTNIYLQGYLVDGWEEGYGKEKCVVHLNSSEYQARVPDRSVLCDNAKNNSLKSDIKSYLEEAALAFILHEKENMNMDAFSLKWFDILVSISEEYVSDLPLPKSKLAYFSGMPRPEYEGECIITSNSSLLALERDDIEYIVNRYSIYDFPHDMDNEDQRALNWANYFYFSKAHVSGGKIPSKHWSSDRTIEIEDIENDIIVEGNNEIRFENVSVGEFGKVTLSLCDSFTIKGCEVALQNKEMIHLKDITVTDEMLFIDGVLYVPTLAYSADDIVRQNIDCLDYSGFCNVLDEYVKANAVSDIEAVIQAYRDNDPAKVIESILKDNADRLWNARQLLANKDFQLSIDFNDLEGRAFRSSPALSVKAEDKAA
ncbi:hypothetical protein A3715_27635, partial [Oleiphilus sp. HI0009]